MKYLVIGLGNFGMTLAKELTDIGHDVIGVDSNVHRVEEIKDRISVAYIFDATERVALQALPLDEIDCAVVAIGGSLANSVLATMNVKELGIPKVVCKAHDDTHRQVLLKLGADQVVIPEQENAGRLARSLSSHNVLEYIELSEDYGIIEVPAPKSWQGKTLRDLNVRARLGVNIIAIKRGDKIDVSPSANYAIEPKDIMVVLGDTVALKGVQKL